MAEVRERGRRHDRWVSWIVIGVFIGAMGLGWVVKLGAEGRSVPFAADGVRASYPAGWVRKNVSPPFLLQVEDRGATSAATTLTLQRRPSQGSLGRISQALAVERGQSWGECNAYRVLATEESASFYGYTGMHVAFAYVQVDPNPFMETTPVVMRGEDYLFPAGDQVYIVTITAAEANLPRARQALHAFLAGLQVP